MTDEIDELAVQIFCTYCGSNPGHWCRTVTSGNVTQHLHGARTRLFYDAWGQGFMEGQKAAEEHHYGITSSDAAEYLRKYAPIGTNLHDCYAFALERTRDTDHYGRTIRAGRVLRLA